MLDHKIYSISSWDYWINFFRIDKKKILLLLNPCGNFSDTSTVVIQLCKGSIGHAFTVCIRTENQNQMSFCPFTLREISVLTELILGPYRKKNISFLFKGEIYFFFRLCFKQNIKIPYRIFFCPSLFNLWTIFFLVKKNCCKLLHLYFYFNHYFSVTEKNYWVVKNIFFAAFLQFNDVEKKRSLEKNSKTFFFLL